jgi:uncharacterized membrane protein (UPF0127 family)
MSVQPCIIEASGFWQRLKGLMLSAPLPDDYAFLIRQCSSVHTFFMRYPLDLAYLAGDGQIVKLERNVPPWCVSWGGVSARHTLEMSVGGIDRWGLSVGKTVVLSKNE